MPPSGTPPSGMPPSGTPPSGMPPSGTPPSAMPPSGMPPSGTPPSETPPSGTLPSGTPPSGTPPSGTPPSGLTTPVPLLPPQPLAAAIATARTVPQRKKRRPLIIATPQPGHHRHKNRCAAHPQQVTPSAFCRCTKASGRADCLTSSMPKFEVHIPAADAQSLNVTLRVDADHWMAALKTGLHKLGAQGSSVQNVLVDIQDDNSVHITEAQSGRVFRIRELSGEEAASAPVKRSANPIPGIELQKPLIELSRPSPAAMPAPGAGPAPVEPPADPRK